MLFFGVFRQLLKSKEWVLSVFPCGKCYGHQRGIVLCSVIGAELSVDLELCLYRTYGSFTGIIVVGYGVMGQEQEDVFPVHGKSLAERVEQFLIFLVVNADAFVHQFVKLEQKSEGFGAAGCCLSWILLPLKY